MTSLNIFLFVSLTCDLANKKETRNTEITKLQNIKAWIFWYRKTPIRKQANTNFHTIIHESNH